MRISLISAVSLIILSFLVDFSLWMMMKSRIHKRIRLWRTLWWGFACLCYVVLLCVLLAPRRSADADIISYMWALFAYISVYGSKIIALLVGVIGYIPKLWKRKPANLLLYAGLPLGVMTFAAIWWGALVTRHKIEVTEVTIVSPKIPS